MFYLGHTCIPQSWHGLQGGVGWGGGVWSGCCGWQQGFKYKKKRINKKGLIYFIYTIQYGFCITHSVGSVTKAKLWCSCDEPSSEAITSLSLSLDISLFLCPLACFSSQSAYSGGGNSVAPKGVESCSLFSYLLLAVILHSWNVLLPSTQKVWPLHPLLQFNKNTNGYQKKRREASVYTSIVILY